MSEKPQPDKTANPYARYADEAKGFKLGPPPEVSTDADINSLETERKSPKTPQGDRG